MKTTHVSEKISDYVLDLLSSAERHDVEAHIARCERCQLQIRQERVMVQMVSRSLQALPVPQSDTVTQLRPRFRPPASRAHAPRQGWQTLYVMVACVVMLAVGSWQLSSARRLPAPWSAPTTAVVVTATQPATATATVTKFAKGATPIKTPTLLLQATPVAALMSQQ